MTLIALSIASSLWDFNVSGPKLVHLFRKKLRLLTENEGNDRKIIPEHIL
jgi:hypothetical protein